MEQCNPEWPSVPRVAFHIYDTLRNLADVTLVTHERNREGLDRACPGARIHYIEESAFNVHWFRLVHALAGGGATNWPLFHALSYPVFAEFDRKVFRKYRDEVESGAFDAVMCTTPILPRYPYSISRACVKTPFILGPVNGGLPFPQGFEVIARKESAHFNFLRAVGRLIPGYLRTYQSADAILAGSGYTAGYLRDTLRIPAEKLHLVPENGVKRSFFAPEIRPVDPGAPLRLLFAGRLVPYKGADMAIEALHRASRTTTRQLQLTIAGDGPERSRLGELVARWGLEDRVVFAGMIPPDEMPSLFSSSDLFVFPSIREFGGAVVLEAMAAGLPCVVADHGGIGEYVTPATGWKISPDSREHLVEEMAKAICHLAKRPRLQETMARCAREHASDYSWEAKAETIIRLIRGTIEAKQQRERPDRAPAPARTAG